MTSNENSLDPGEPLEIPQSLKTWPYATRQLLRMPHPEIVEGHARNLLSRALNVGRLTAFVGSGASMAYGRISWIDMLYTAQEAVRARYQFHKSGLTEAGAHIKILHKLLDKHKIERNSRGDASSQLAVFQLSEELDETISAVLKEQGKEQSSSTFRETIMWVTRDERGHAEQLLKDAFLDRDVSEYSDTRIDSDAIEKMVRRFLWRGKKLPKNRHFPQLELKPGNKQYDNLKTELSSVLGNETSAADILEALDEFLRSPLRRHRLAARLRRLPELQRFKVLEILTNAIAPEDRIPTQEPITVRRRSEIIPSYRDPLLILHRDLHIRRFLTTNYDHEIEQLFTDSGYLKSLERLNPNNSRGGKASDPIAPMFKDTIFNHEGTGELAALATSDRNRRRANWVVHLHGRADSGGKIIVTEDDYQQHYARDDEHRSSIDDAIKLAFSAQPILFVGIGMEEVDLLRPLREFMSEPTRLGDRLAVALLPADKSEKDEAAQKIRLLRGYGV